MPSSGSMRVQIGTLIIATSVMQLANGFFGTLISLRVATADFGAVLAVSGRLILVSGLASVLRPHIGASIMARSGINGLFYFMAAAALLLALAAAGSSLATEAPRHLRRPFEILASQPTPLAQKQLGSSDDRAQPG